MAIQKIKHPGFILGLKSQFTDFSMWRQDIPNLPFTVLGPEHYGMSLSQGVNKHRTRSDYDNWFLAAQPWLTIQRRHELEQDVSVRQILPYTVIAFHNQTDPLRPLKYFNYQRGKGIGEARLAGDQSIGAGGHIDLVDVKFDEHSVIDLEATIFGALMRELSEELEFCDEHGVKVEPEVSTELGARFDRPNLQPYGFIRDDTNEVGQVHLGVVNVVYVPDTWTVTCREPELLTGERATAAELLARGVKFENWSQMLLESFAIQGQPVDSDAAADDETFALRG